MSDTGQTTAIMVDNQGVPLKKSLARALRRQKLRALMLIAPLLLFVLITFIAPIADMLFRSVKNEIVADTIPRTVRVVADWEPESGTPGEPVFAALTRDLMIATERKMHTRLGSRLNYESAGMSSLFRKSGRSVDDIGEEITEQFVALDPAWEEPRTLATLLGGEAWLANTQDWIARKEEQGRDFDELPPVPRLSDAAREALPRTADAYAAFAATLRTEDEESAYEEDPWHMVYLSLYDDLSADPAAAEALGDARLSAAADAVSGFTPISTKDAFIDIDEDWGDNETWATIKTFSPPFTSGYFLNAADLELTGEGIALKPEDERIYIKLFIRTMILSLTITGTCILLGYPVAWILANLPMRTANLLMILVLLPFWTSLLVRTSAWKVLLQQQGVINDILVWVGIVSDSGRLVMINNQLGTVIAMTHILLPFMILPLYSVMKTIPPTYLRAAKSLGATNWTAFWRVYFPQSVPGIGAGSILVFILAIGYYITPELVGGTDGTFISNRIAYHISTSLNWGLAAALGTALLVIVLALYWVYDRMVGIDNVKLG
ncbi:ABC transporter permease [Algicella marina]|uniref:ABC transporter permease subunit n=1 Tax=Algicella marina TaxID=2683284 RepID=A0A6P1SWW5_9RHOB|nr:ABC transporter permease [Algicella marina]QHQ34150.1 ABC transporter permease subunit [Algicella marina]